MLHKLISLAIFCLFLNSCLHAHLVEQMSIEEKVGQLLMVYFHGEKVNEEARRLVQETKVGGIIYYNWANGLTSPDQVYALSKNLQRFVRANRFPIPLFLAIDQEGGAVTRLKEGFTLFPGNRALGMTGLPHLAEISALAIGRELKAVGINMNLAPVVDVNSNQRNPVIGIRAFGDTPEIVVAFGERALSGYNRAGIITTLKHFPGHGDVEVDSHKDLPIIHKSLEELEEVELLPFMQFASSADVIMTAHILVPALDSENCATISKKVLMYLREKIGFKGVIISDSLAMKGVLKKCHTLEKAAIQAFLAGCDILVLGGDELFSKDFSAVGIAKIHLALVEAVKSGQISESRLNEATQKILNLKERYIGVENLNHQVKRHKIILSKKHRAIAQKIAALALKTITEEPIKDLHEKRIYLFAPQLISSSIYQTNLLGLGKKMSACFFNDLNPSKEEIEKAKVCAQEADVLFICSYDAWKYPTQAQMIHSLLETGKPVVLIVTRDPSDSFLFPNAQNIYHTFSPTTPSIQAVCDQLIKN